MGLRAMTRSSAQPAKSGTTPDVTTREALLAQLSWAVGRPPLNGNAVEVLRNGDQIFPAMLADIEDARRCVYFESFVYWTGRAADEFAEAFSRAAQRGVDVRVILDAYGSNAMDPSLVERMRQSGVRVLRFRDLRRWRLWQVDHRTHRRVLLIDHEIAYTGGVGIAREWEGDARDPSEWRDNHFRIRGPAVAGIFAGFVDNWSEACPMEPCSVPADFGHLEGARGDSVLSVIASSPSSEWSPVATLYRDIWVRARKRVRIATPYFVPDEPTSWHMKSARERGVEVRVLIPGPNVDKRLSELAGRSQMLELLEHGLEVRCYLPTMYHCKLVIVDDEVAIFGTTNFNQRSLGKDDELVVMGAGDDLLQKLNQLFDQDWAESRDWRECPISSSWWARVASWFIRPFREQF